MMLFCVLLTAVLGVNPLKKLPFLLSSFVHAQNSPSTVVHGCTTVEDGSNGLTAPMILRFLPSLPDTFTRLLEKCAKFYFLKMQQLNKI